MIFHLLISFCRRSAQAYNANADKSTDKKTNHTITTNSEGKATSVNLYLSKYRVVETQTLAGYVLNKEPSSVELAYAGQEVAVTNQLISYSK